MINTIPVYRKKVDIETGLPILDENGQEISEHVRDIIVPINPLPTIEYKPTLEDLEAIEVGRQLDLEFQQKIKNLTQNP